MVNPFLAHAHGYTSKNCLRSPLLSGAAHFLYHNTSDTFVPDGFGVVLYLLLFLGM